ncbi:MAG: protoglobin domain-containing protein [Thermodesulfovibrio sp.]|nr:protoglobin domain-containing protein [Thermodesulfovibrio sp.]
MRPFKEIKANYHFTKEDEEILIELKPAMEKRVDRVVEAVHQWINTTESARKIFKDESLKLHVMNLIKDWFIRLFSGKYDNTYYDYLIRIGQKHESVGVEPHYLIRALNIVKNSCIDVLCDEIELCSERERYFIAINKIIDINLDIINSSYIEEEIKSYSIAYIARGKILRLGEIFSQITSTVLVMALILLTGAVIYLCGRDIYQIFTGKIEQNVITALGSVLILWVMLELINTELSHLRGGKFKISVFVGVALVTTIREVMIATLKHDSIEFIGALVASVLVIGIIFWLVKKTEEDRR